MRENNPHEIVRVKIMRIHINYIGHSFKSVINQVIFRFETYDFHIMKKEKNLHKF